MIQRPRPSFFLDETGKIEPSLTQCVEIQLGITPELNYDYVPISNLHPSSCHVCKGKDVPALQCFHRFGVIGLNGVRERKL